MNDYRPSWLVAFLRASLGSSLSIAWGGGLLWYGMSVDASFGISQSKPIDVYSFHIMGAILIGIGMLGFAYQLIKLRAPTPARDRITEPGSEPGDATFDADAALARYLATKQDRTDVAPPADSAAARPVFGRKQA